MDNREIGRFSPYIREISEIRNNWGFFLGLGILLIIIGAVALSYNFVTTLYSVMILGVLLSISGVVQIAQSFFARKWNGLFLSLFSGILYLVVGFLCIAKPGTTAINLTLLIAAFCLIGGAFRMITSALLRFEQWGWVFFNGLITFILGMLILSEWPVSGLWVIGLFVGIDMILTGWSWVLLALAAKPAEIK